MRCVDYLAIFFSGGQFYLILFLGITIKINHCCVISLAQYISTVDSEMIIRLCNFSLEPGKNDLTTVISTDDF